MKWVSSVFASRGSLGPSANFAACQPVGDLDRLAVDYRVEVGIPFDAKWRIRWWSYPACWLFCSKADASSTLILKLLLPRLLHCAALIYWVVNLFGTHEGLLCFSAWFLVSLRRYIGKEMQMRLQLSHCVIQHHDWGLHLRYWLFPCWQIVPCVLALSRAHTFRRFWNTCLFLFCRGHLRVALLSKFMLLSILNKLLYDGVFSL